MRYGVIDLGTNTFHLLIVEIENGNFKAVCRIRRFIHLAENGISTIGEAAFKRGIDALCIFKKAVEEHEVTQLRVLGTAALRRASNGAAFREKVKILTGLHIEIIDGNEEAALIYYGVRQAIPLGNEPTLLMDIGGGSVEFILANEEKIFWQQSFPIGVTVLFKQFHHSEPITASEIQILNHFLETTLQSLSNTFEQYPATTLVGASGTFDVLEGNLTVTEKYQHGVFLVLEELYPLMDKAIAANLEERFAMPEVPDNRAELIVVAFLLIRFILKNYPIQKLGVSNYAMKEGMFWKMIQS